MVVSVQCHSLTQNGTERVGGALAALSTVVYLVDQTSRKGMDTLRSRQVVRRTFIPLGFALAMLLAGLAAAGASGSGRRAAAPKPRPNRTLVTFVSAGGGLCLVRTDGSHSVRALQGSHSGCRVAPGVQPGLRMGSAWPSTTTTRVPAP